MARMRSVKPEFWADEDLAEELCRDARLLYIGLWNLADEHARLRGDPRFIKGQIFPYDDDLDPKAIDVLLDQIADSGRAQRYKVNGRSYLFLPKLARHQRLEAEKVPSRLPGPEEADPDDPAPGAETCANESAPRADELSLKHVAGGMEHVAGSSSSSSEIAARSPDADESEHREDVERLCEHLADRIEGNGAKRPTIIRKWRDAARLLIDKDGHTEADVHAAIDWCQDDEFWRSNILSMPKLRDQYDRLSMQARSRRARASPVALDRHQQHTNAVFGDAMQRARAQDALEARGDP